MTAEPRAARGSRGTSASRVGHSQPGGLSVFHCLPNTFPGSPATCAGLGSHTGIVPPSSLRILPCSVHTQALFHPILSVKCQQSSLSWQHWVEISPRPQPCGTGMSEQLPVRTGWRGGLDRGTAPSPAWRALDVSPAAQAQPQPFPAVWKEQLLTAPAEGAARVPGAQQNAAGGLCWGSSPGRPGAARSRCCAVNTNSTCSEAPGSAYLTACHCKAEQVGCRMDGGMDHQGRGLAP